MDYGIHAVLAKNLSEAGVIANIRLIEFHAFSGNLLYSADRFRRTVDKIICRHNLIACVQQFNGGMRTDIARAACKKNRRHLCTPFFNVVASIIL